MLSDIGVLLLMLMIVMSFGGVGVCFWVFLKCLYNKQAGKAVISILFGGFITITSLGCCIPFLKTHGSYSNFDRCIIILFVLANIFLITFVVKKLLGTLNGLNKKQLTSH